MQRWFLGLFLSFFLSSFAKAAPSEEGDREAGRAAWRQGSVEYALGHFAAAARQYEDAYRLLQDPALLFNLGQARRLSGAVEPALAAYRSFLRTSPPDALDRELAERRIAELEARGARLADVPSVAAPKTAPSLLDSRATVAAPDADDRPRRRAWLWGAGGAVLVAAGVATALVITSRTPDVIPGRNGTVVIK
jgi:hypothetical protein